LPETQPGAGSSDSHPLARHRTDYFALFAGLLFAALGVGFILDGLEAWDADVTWVPPIVLVALGAGGVLATVTRHGGRE
jgi:hypothetical protein